MLPLFIPQLIFIGLLSFLMEKFELLDDHAVCMPHLTISEKRG
jgi:hypothetical protein